MNEMKYIGTNRGLNLNPGDLHVYRKRQHRGNATPAGVGQPLVVLHFYKHLMPLASTQRIILIRMCN